MEIDIRYRSTWGVGENCISRRRTFDQLCEGSLGLWASFVRTMSDVACCVKVCDVSLKKYIFDQLIALNRCTSTLYVCVDTFKINFVFMWITKNFDISFLPHFISFREVRMVFTSGEAGFSEIRGTLVLVIQRDQKRCHRNIHLL
jgi:hypothetical protein